MAFVYFLDTYLTLNMFLCVWIFFLIWIWRDEENLPPGPRALPFIGNMHQFYKNPYTKFMQWAQLYGPIFLVRMGQDRVVVVNDPKLVKELFSHKFTTGRSLNNPVSFQMTKGSYGTFNSIGSTWSEQRLFTLKTLRGNGFNTSNMETIILEEVKVTLEWLSKRENVPISVTRLFNEPLVNTLWSIVAGERQNWENGDSHVVKCIEKMLSAFQTVTTNGLVVAPFLRYIFPQILGWNEYVKCTEDVHNLFKEAVEKRKIKNGTEVFGKRMDFIDKHMAEIEQTTDSSSSFFKDVGYKNLVVGLFDLFFAASETTSLTLAWALLYLSIHPKVQMALHREIDNVLKQSCVLAHLADRPNMPYLEAVIMETMRKSSILPLGVPHVVTEDFKFKGYTLRKDTYLVANIFGIQNDPNVWCDPEVFRPSRFLNKDQTKVVKHDSLIPFSEGKRKCIGEKFAREQMFLFLAGILRKYRVEPEFFPESVADQMKPGFGNFLLYPKAFKIILIPRNPT